MLHIKLAQFAVRCALPPRRSESPVCATDNKPSCVLHLLGWLIGSCGFSSLERRPEFWVLQFQQLLLLIMAKKKVLVCSKSPPTLFNPVACGSPGSSAHGISQAGRLERVAILCSRRASWSRDQTRVSGLLHWQVDSLPVAPPRKP